MRTILLFVGKEFQENTIFVEYLKANATKALVRIDEIRYFSELDKNLIVVIQKLMQQHVVIFTNKKSFVTISKIVATLHEDTLVLKEGRLIPSKSTQYIEASYILGNINVVLATPMQKMPQILKSLALLEQKFYIFNAPKTKVLDTLESLAQNYRIAFKFLELSSKIIEVVATSSEEVDMELFSKNLYLLFNRQIVMCDNLIDYIIARFSKKLITLSFAESCTGGLIASTFTARSGSSAILMGSVVSYSNEIKTKWLNIKESIFIEHGAVSEECVSAMLDGIEQISQSDIALAVSGIAGPTGGSDYKPVGTVVIGAKYRTQKILYTLYFDGDRNYIQQQSLYYAIGLLFDIAKKELFD